MRLGPLGFLAAVGGGVVLWTASRVPVVIASARADVAAAQAWQAYAARSPLRVMPPLPPPMLAALPSLPARMPTSGAVADLPPILTRAAIQRRAPGPLKRPLASPLSIAAASIELATAPPIEPPAAKPLDRGFANAAAAYADLARGDRRAAARRFAAALAATPDAVNAANWRAELRVLDRRWSGDAYVLVRGAGPAGFGVAPLLGGGQSGAALAFTPDPLQRRPLAVVARFAVAHEGAGFGIAGVDGGSLQAALGVRWQVVRGATLTAERLIAGGAAARDAWVLRAAGGTARTVGPVRLDAYAEAGIVGARRRDTFASAQARAVVPLPAGFDLGAGSWASVQAAGDTVHRVDVGPTLGWRSGLLTAHADWRFRVSGNAAPGSGPALTLSAAF